MLEQINELIKQHLPQQVGSALMEELEELSELRELFKRQKDKIQNLETVLTDYRAKNEKYSDLDTREKGLAVREKELERKEIEAAVRKEFEDRIELLRSSRVQDMKEVLMTVFRNKVIVETIHKNNDSQSIYNSANGTYEKPNFPTSERTARTEQIAEQ